MIRSKTVSIASMAGSSRRSKAGDDAACLKGQNRAYFGGPSPSLRPLAMPQTRYAQALCAAICSKEPLHAHSQSC